MNIAINPEVEVYTNADYIMSVLKHMGTEFIFGVPGGAIEPFFNAIARTVDGPELVIARHECGAAFMADGYYRETKKLPVVCSTTGPGATNLITGVASAYVEKIPMLVITAQTPLPKFGRRSLQDSSATAVDTVSMFENITVYNSLVAHPEQLEHMLGNAIVNAFMLKGPVHLSIPSDVMRDATMPRPINILRRDFRAVDQGAIEELIQRVHHAKRMIVCIGESGEASTEIMQLIDHTKSSFVCTPMGKAFANEGHGRYRGVVGFAGHRTANALLEDPSVDLILAVGTNLDELSTSGWTNGLCSNRVIHIDSNPEHFTRSLYATHVYGDIQTIVNKLLDTTRTYSQVRPQYIDTIEVKEHLRCFNDCSPVKPQFLMQCLSELPNNVRFYVDAGNSWAWCTHYLLRSDNTGLYRIAMGFGSMGWSVGACIGSAIATRQPTVCIVGDGSYMMSAQELSVAVQHKLPIVFVVLNDSAMGMVMHGQRLGGQASIGWELPITNFAQMAEAVGAKGIIAQDSTELSNICFSTLFENGPALIDVRIDREEVPPMADRIKGLSKSVTPGS